MHNRYRLQKLRGYILVLGLSAAACGGGAAGDADEGSPAFTTPGAPGDDSDALPPDGATVPTLAVTIEEPSTVLVSGEDGFTTAWMSLDPGSYQYPVPATLRASIEYAVVTVSDNTAVAQVTTSTLDHPSDGFGTLTVLATNQSGEPITDAVVEVAGGRSLTTNAEGLVQFAGLPRGLLQLSVSAEGHVFQRTTASALAESALTVVRLDDLGSAPSEVLQPGVTETIGAVNVTLSTDSEPTRVSVVDGPAPGGFADPWGILVADLVPEAPIYDPVTVDMPIPESLIEMFDQLPAELSLVQHDPATGRRRVITGSVSGTPARIAVTVPDLLGDQFSYFSGGFRTQNKLVESTDFVSTLEDAPIRCRDEYTVFSASVETSTKYTYDISPLPDIENAPGGFGFGTKVVFPIDVDDQARRIFSFIPPGHEGGLYRHTTDVTITIDVYKAIDSLWKTPDYSNMTDDEIAAATFGLFKEIDADQAPWDYWIKFTELSQTYQKNVGSALESPYAAEARPVECDSPTTTFEAGSFRLYFICHAGQNATPSEFNAVSDACPEGVNTYGCAPGGPERFYCPGGYVGWVVRLQNGDVQTLPCDPPAGVLPEQGQTLEGAYDEEQFCGAAGS